uniref:Uncharacterized protein n=1 Tax=Lepeophtheirus salmonis TaxID=72036 RepID=A0A0K2SVJ4_LEPSM
MNMGILLKGEPLDSYYPTTMEDRTTLQQLNEQKYINSTSSIPTPLHSGENSSSEWSGVLGTEMDLPPLCAGCRLRIVDDFYLTSVEKKWHASCLKCSECGGELEDQSSCFEREGHIYCKEDFLKMQSCIRTCSKCSLDIRPSDLVMKAKDFYFHVECFRCSSCDVTLVKGDLFGMVNDLLFCKDHYDQVEEEDDDEELEEDFGGCMGGGYSASYPPPSGPYDWGPPHSYDGSWYGGGPIGDHPTYPGGTGHPATMIHSSASSPGGLIDNYPFDNNNKPNSSFKKRRGRKKRPKMITGEGFTAEGGVYGPEGGNTPVGLAGLDPLGGGGMILGGGHGGGNQPKTKRARTSFKHHQLRIMKAHFQINQNPDSRELKMLSQKTGLDKKVLQVWFQNSRAKWRRTKTQDGVPPSGGEDHMGLGDASSPASDCSGNGPLIPCC